MKKQRTGIALIAALAATASAWTGAGLAADGAQQEQETISARTGEILDDCNNIRLDATGSPGHVDMTADCRTSDTTLSRTARSYRLSDKITNNAGTLTWSSSHSSYATTCNRQALNTDTDGDLVAQGYCTTDGETYTLRSGVMLTSVNLTDRIGVNSSGDFYDK